MYVRTYVERRDHFLELNFALDVLFFLYFKVQSVAGREELNENSLGEGEGIFIADRGFKLAAPGALLSIIPLPVLLSKLTVTNSKQLAELQFPFPPPIPD